MSGNQKSCCAISPATYSVRLAGSGGKYTGRNSATRPDNVRIDRSQPIRSAITVAGIIGHADNNSRICGSTTSTIEPAGRREYFGGPSAANAALTVFFEHPNTRAITLIGIFSARCNRLISAQSSTHNTPSSSLARCEPGSRPKGSKFGCRAGVIFRVPSTDPVLWGGYDWSGRSIERHRAQIREELGFREATRDDEQ